MRKKLKYYDFYMKCMKTGRIPKSKRINVIVNGERTTIFNGLCSLFPEVKKFTPTHSDCVEYGVVEWGFWAGDLDKDNLESRFGEMRQTIVLFLAAMNNEL